MSYSVATSVQSLIHSVSEPKDAQSVAKQVTVASALLTKTPALFAVTLDVLASAYRTYILQPEQGDGLAEDLREADKTVELLLTYSPDTWSHRIVKWCIEIVDSVCKKAITPQNLEELLCFWLGHKKLKSILRYLDMCTEYLVISGREDQCVDILLRKSLTKSMELNWLLTHVLSTQPTILVPKFLEKVLQLSISPSSPLFVGVAHVMAYLSYSYQAVVIDSVISVVESVISGNIGNQERWSEQIEFLLRLAPLCGGLLSFTSQDCLKLVTAEKIKTVVIGGSSVIEGSERTVLSSDEDEGEVKSDDETLGKMSQSRVSRRGDVEEALVELLMVLEKKTAVEALSQLLETYSCLGAAADTQEEAMEEGEISTVSLLSVVQESCWSILDRLQQKFIITAKETLAPGGRGGRGGCGSGDREFLVGLHCGLCHWPKMLLQQNLNMKCREWLSVAITSISVCCGELQAAKTLATMLFYCRNRNHVECMMKIYQHIYIKHSQLAVTTVKEAFSSCNNVTDACNLCANLWSITANDNFHFQEKFVSALELNVFALSSVLSRLSKERKLLHSLRVLQMLSKVVKLGKSEGDYSTHCQILANVLSSFIWFIHVTNDPIGNLCFGQCMVLLANWAGESAALRMYLLNLILRKAIDHESGSSFHYVNQLLGLMELVAGGDGALVMSLIMDVVAPHLPSNSAHWLPGEGPRSAYLEWSLSVKSVFDKHPILWHLLLYSAHSGCHFRDCEPIVCSLLLVSTQHWFSCRCSPVSGVELQVSVLLVETLAAAGWLPFPLAYSAEILDHLNSSDIYLLMSAISDFIKINLEDLRRGAHPLLTDAVCMKVLKGVVVRNIHKLGNVYSHYVMI